MSPDTIHFYQRRRLLEDTLSEDGDWVRHWHVKDSPEERAYSGDYPLDTPFTIYHNGIKKFKVKGTGNLITEVHVPSLSALLFGHNGVLFKGPDDFQLAYQILDHLLSGISIPEGKVHKYTRFDVAFQFRSNFARLESALLDYMPPGSRKGQSHKDGESVRFDFKGLQVEFYSKSRKFGVDPDILPDDQRRILSDLKQLQEKGELRSSLDELRQVLESKDHNREVVRCEVRFMNSRKVEEYFNNELINKGPSPMLLRHVVSRVLGNFFPKPMEKLKPKKLSQYDMLNIIQKYEPTVVRMHMAALNKDSRRRTRAGMRKAKLPEIHRELRLGDLIPEDRPPVPVDMWRRPRESDPPEFRKRLDEEIRHLRVSAAEGKLDPEDYGRGMHPFIPVDHGSCED